MLIRGQTEGPQFEPESTHKADVKSPLELEMSSLEPVTYSDTSPIFICNVVYAGVGQGSALSPILSALVVAPILHILEKRSKDLNIDVASLSFVDDGLSVAQSNHYDNTLTILFPGLPNRL